MRDRPTNAKGRDDELDTARRELAALRLKVAEQHALLEAAERTEWELREEIQRLINPPYPGGREAPN